MRWITGGPDLPPELLQALEDGQLVLFCGAGISYPAGLPTFRGLVERVYERLAETMQGLERVEFENKNYDRVLGLLERRIGASFVRRAAIAALHLDVGAELPTHKALLKLATTQNDVCRLVTTNFDRGFEFAARPGVAIESAPKLPVPKLGVWNSVVHLHGLITDRDPDGRTLVLTSADFGTAYLTERWASRFVSELFRRFTVLFIGYSVEDPVIRYMMDAFAADRALGEGVGKAYVVDGTSATSRPQKTAVWEAKGVIPLLYDDGDGHKALHLTLAKWADCHASGLLGRDSIISEHASSKRPMKPFDDDPVVAQVLWAISEPSGHSALVFAQQDPLPPIEWLEVFDERGFFRLAVSPDKGGIRSSLVVGGHRSNGPGPLHPVTRALGEWLVRHIDNPDLLSWMLRSGCLLHPDFRDVLRRRLDTGLKLASGMKQVWEILASNVPILWEKTQGSWFHLHARLPTGEWNTVLRLELLDAIAPVLALGPATLPKFFSDLPVDETKVSYYADAEVTLRCHDHATLIRDAVGRSPCREQLLTDIADDLTTLVKSAMELFELIQKSDHRSDSSYSDQPSISPHKQNTGRRHWALLIELLRDAWIQMLKADRDRARRLVERWRTIPYPIFRRLAFYAMAESDLYSPQESLGYLLADEEWWLWSIYVYREKFRLLEAIWPAVSDKDSDRLTAAILKGPPRMMYRSEIPEERFDGLAEREIWLLLSKLQAWGRQLTDKGAEYLRNLNQLHPEWRLAAGDRSEFTIWMEGGVGEPPVEKEGELIDLPDEAVLQRLATEKTDRRDDLAKWRRIVIEQPGRASRLLSSKAAVGSWPNDLWQAALEGFASEKRSTQEWPLFIAALLLGPNILFESLARSLAWTLHEVSPALDLDSEGEMWQAWDRLQPYAFHDDYDAAKDPIFAALNRPAGLLTQALIDRLAARRPRTAADLPNEIWARLTTIAEGTDRSYMYARVLEASRLAWLYAMNPLWVEQHLLKYFDWEHSTEAPAVWQGYLWQARVTPELWTRIKEDFLAALKDKQRLGEFEGQICTIFGFICIDEPDSLTTDETQAALRSLDAKGRAEIAHVIYRRVAGAGDKGQAMWTTRIAPWLDRAWPKDRALVDAGSALNFAQAVVYIGDAFDAAVEEITPFLTCSDQCSFLVEELGRSDHPDRHPASTLQLMALIVDTDCRWPDQQMRAVMTRIVGAMAELANDSRFRRLDEYLRRFNL